MPVPDYSIDTITWRKDSHLPVGVGWSMRPGGIAPSTIVIHTTSAARPSTFDAEARYLYGSRDVSAHFLNGKAGQIVQFLSPDLEAWHAGVAQSAYMNSHSIGIENHVSVGEPWTGTQRDSLTWLVRRLMARYRIAPEQIETHRRVAIPGPDIRKHDPEGWPDAAFYAWRAQLLTPPTPPTPPTKRYRVKHIMISQRQAGGPPYAGELAPGDEVVADVWYADNGGTIHLQDGRGFVVLSELEAV